MLERLRSLIEEGLYEQAGRDALKLAESPGPDGLRAEAFLLTAECAAKQGNANDAERFLKRAMEMAPVDSESMHRAALNLGKIYLRRNEISLAEQVFLEALARHSQNEMLISMARFGLGQVYDAQRRWDVAASVYHQAEDGFARLGMMDWVFSAQLNRAWALLMHWNMEDAAGAIGACQNNSKHASERQRHILNALIAYHRYHTGSIGEAADLTAEIVTAGGPSAFANCLAAVTAGWIAHQANMIPEAQKALKLAESLMFPASHETGSTDIINLVNELRSRAA